MTHGRPGTAAWAGAFDCHGKQLKRSRSPMTAIPVGDLAPGREWRTRRDEAVMAMTTADCLHCRCSAAPAEQTPETETCGDWQLESELAWFHHPTSEIWAGVQKRTRNSTTFNTALASPCHTHCDLHTGAEQ